MKTLIVYSSKSGNTRKLAEAVSSLSPGKSDIKSVQENPDPKGYDLVVLGFWLQAGKADPRSSEYLEKLENVKLFLFATHGAGADSDHAQNAMKAAKALATSCEVVGTFNCQGEAKAEVLAKAQENNPLPPWVKDAAGAVGHPDSKDIDNLQKALAAAIAG
ncbi:MAG: flavodoxin family protein [Gammaproteobacteria bacterium]|nr:MAG: flavodoxin family protein [Gammaproteobacteria bacterium]